MRCSPATSITPTNSGFDLDRCRVSHGSGSSRSRRCPRRAEDYGLTAWPKTSGSRGFSRLRPGSPAVGVRPGRLGCQTVAREVERRAPDLARAGGGRKNAKGCSSTSTRTQRPPRSVGLLGAATPDARVSTRAVDEVADCKPRRSRIATVPGRIAELGDRGRAWTQRRRARPAAELAEELGPRSARREGAKTTAKRADGRRQSSKPLIEIARTKPKTRRWPRWTWRDRYIRCGRRYSGRCPARRHARAQLIWYRIRINLEHVPADQPPGQRS